MADIVTPEPFMDVPAIEVTMPNKSWVYLLGLSLSVMVGGLSGACIRQLLLPVQTSQLAPNNTNTVFTLVIATGSFAGLFAAPLIGAFSDRTTWRYGRRPLWIAFGIIAAAVGMGIMSLASSVPMLITGEVITQIGLDTVLAITTALIPDQVPLSQRPFISSCVGIAPNVGGVIGLFLVSRFTDTRIISQGYWLMAIISFCCVMFFLIILRDAPVSQDKLPPRFSLGSFLVGFVRPLRSRDFCLTFVSRCFGYLSYTLLGIYTLFYLHNGLHFTTPQAATGVANFQLVLTAVLILSAFTAGWLSKRTDRLKPFIIGGGFMMAVGLSMMIALPSWTGLLTSAVVFGIGLGMYLGVDIALAVRVLPSQDACGKDLGIIYDAIFLPLIFSPIIGGTVLNLFHNNFAALFMIGAVSSIIAALLIFPIKTVR